MTTLEEKLGYTFQDRGLLENALTHSSCANESRGRLQSNERLEFLGDSILGMVVADHLYRNHPDLPEGELTRTRSALVCEESLVEVAQALGLGEYLHLGRGGGRRRPEASLHPGGRRGGGAGCGLFGRRHRLGPEDHTEVYPKPGGGRADQAPRTTRPPSRSWSSGRAGRCWPTSWWARRVRTTTSAFLWRWT